MNLTETKVASEQVYVGGFIQVYKDKVRLPDGTNSTREYIKHPGAVAIMALLENGNLLMERQFRYAPNQEFIEIPAGKIDAGEAILKTAQRELLEETGYIAQHWQHLASAWPCIGFSDEKIDYFLAKGLSFQGRKLDEGEFLDVFEMTLDDALSAVKSGKINDSKTIVGLFWLEKTLRNK